MSAPLFRIGAFGVLALVVIVAGCGSADGIAREAVSGAVLMEGRPLASATIVFISTAPGSREVSSGLVQDGRFSIPRNDGPTPGPYKVRISRAIVGQANSDETRGSPSKITRETLPEKYNTATVLTAEIKAGEPNELEFNLDAD